MTPFSELYGKYYTLVTHILQMAHQKPITLETIRDYIAKEGFLETPTALLPPLTAQDEEGYHLLLKDENTYCSVLKNAPKMPITHLEACWLKSLLDDPKLSLFLEEDDLYLLKKSLASFEPLYTKDMFCFARQNTHDTLYANSTYQKLFKTLTTALRENVFIKITFNLEKPSTIDRSLDTSVENSNLTTLTVAPYKLEYAIREDCFNLLAIIIKDHVPTNLERIPLTAIHSIKTLQPAPVRSQLDAFAKSCKCKEPITFELSNQRSGFDRAFMYLSPYERITEFNEADGTCLVQLYYYPFDEATLMDMLISFGPIIKVLAPTHIRKCLKERIDAQARLFANFFT